MLRKTITINNEFGPRARISTEWVKLARYFISDITIKYNGKRVNGKSIPEVLALTAREGSPVEVIVKGEDEAAALTTLEELVTARFDEET